MMRQATPERLTAFRRKLPVLDEVEDWQLLRKWALSEVYRATMPSGETRIIKWGGDDMAREAAVYSSLLVPLGIRTPIVYAFAQHHDSGLIVMEDVGLHNLEQQHESTYFLEAARELARFRTMATAQLTRTNDAVRWLDSYVLSAEHFIELLNDLLQVERLCNNATLLRAAEYVPLQFEHLYRIIPPTLIHHDYHAKNLVIQGDRIMPIDWSIAYISPHLGDLYCLLMEARGWCDMPERDVLEAYQAELDLISPNKAGLDISSLQWQVQIGGLCWLIKSLRWLVYGGTDTIPGSEEWIPDLLGDMEQLLNRSMQN